MRALIIGFRIVLLLALAGGIVTLLTASRQTAALQEIDCRYLPSRASLQMHAERIAHHLQTRLQEPPLPLLPEPFEQPLDSVSYPYPGPPPHLVTSDLPPRYAVSWSQSEGWLQPPPEIQREFIERLFTRSARRNRWPTPTSSLMLTGVDEAAGNDIILAGTWIKTKEELAFHGAVTSVQAFYSDYAPRWFEEYRKTIHGQLLDSWVWHPAEVRLILQKPDLDTLILLESRSAGVHDLSPDPLEELSARAVELISGMDRDQRFDPDWRTETIWVEESLFPLQDKIEIATPFRIDLEFEKRARNFTWWGIILLVVAAVGLPFTWWRTRSVS